MSFLSDPSEPLTPSERRVWDAAVAKYPRQGLTHMKRTLLRDPHSFGIYIEWYGQFERLAEVITERAMHLLCYAISSTNDCLICSLYFRRILIEGGANPEHPEVAPEEDVFIRFGQAVAKHPNDIPAEVYADLERILPNPDHRVLLCAFAAQMVAANVFNNISKIPLDDSLTAYRADA